MRASQGKSLARALSLATVALLGACAAPHAGDRDARPIEAAAPRPPRAALERIEERWRDRLLRLMERRNAPGISVAAVLPDGTTLTCAVGHADRAQGVVLTDRHRMPSGSVGKTYVAAMALLLAAEDRLDLDATALDLLPEAAWIATTPNAGRYTVRQLLRHESGLPRWVFQEEVLRSIVAEPERVWTTAERMASIEGLEPLFAPGEGWSYSDTNYLVVGAILEAIEGRPIEDLIEERILFPELLRDTVRLDGSPVLRMAQGHVVTSRAFGVPALLLESGRFTVNVQFEGCGGGWASTPTDLALWARSLWSGRFLGEAGLAPALEGAPAEALGAGVRYGPGTMLTDTPSGLLAYHDGFQFGFLTSVGHFRDRDLTLAVQMNTDDLAAPGAPMSMLMQDLAAVVTSELEAERVLAGL